MGKHREDGFRLVTLRDVAAERVEWLWAGRIPFGKITILDGDPGLAKSTMSLDLSARVSTGSPMPDGGPPRPPADVILLSAEDGLGDTIRPRLDAAGADVSRIHALTAVLADDGAECPPVIPRDLVRLAEAVDRTGARLVVIDVLMAYLAGEVNAHHDQDVRRALAPLAAMAERTGAAVLVLRHLNKASGVSAIYRGGGSIGIVGAARSALMVGKDPDDDERLVLASTKANLAPIPASLAYRIVDHDGAAAIEWLGVTGRTAAQLVAVPDSAGVDALDVLRGLFETGAPVTAADVDKQARAAGLSMKQMRNAAQRADVTFRRDGFGPGARYLWDPPPSMRSRTSPRWDQDSTGTHDVEDDYPRSAWDEVMT